MLSEIVIFCKRGKEWLKTNEREVFLVIIVILVAVISFGLGRLSKIREEKTPITIESSPASPKLNFGEAGDTNKIFVASRNGKRYYYAWCKSAQKIKESNRVWFATKEEAEKANYQPTANCRGLK